ncbi:MAG TPA: hypothetical protein VNT75_17715 [Symbiobacteriaceae bacterium]|nr:hypothetical protein [Symbiobacteriaceae bacterium]
MAQLLLIAVVHVGLAAVDWRNADRRERILVVALVLMSFFLAAMSVLGFTPPSPWRLVRTLFEPIGTPFLKVEG